MSLEACTRAKQAAGGPSALAVALNAIGNGQRITSQGVSAWKVVPALRVLAVEKITGISRHELRPDLYPQETAVAAE